MGCQTAFPELDDLFNPCAVKHPFRKLYAQIRKSCILLTDKKINIVSRIRYTVYVWWSRCILCIYYSGTLLQYLLVVINSICFSNI